MAKKTGKPSKAASLTGDLLVRTKRDTKVGFVLEPRDPPKPIAAEPDEPAPAVEPAPAAEVARVAEAVKAAETLRLAEPAPEAAPGPPSAASVLNAHAVDDRIPPPKNDEENPAAMPYLRMGQWSNPTAETSGPQALVQALRAGQLERAEQLFGTMTGLPSGKMREVFYGRSGRELALACRALGFDHLQFASTLILSRKLGLDDAEGDPTVLGNASELFEDTEQETALDVLRRWRRT